MFPAGGTVAVVGLSVVTVPSGSNGGDTCVSAVSGAVGSSTSVIGSYDDSCDLSRCRCTVV